MSDPAIPKSLTILLFNGDKYDIDPMGAPRLLELLLDEKQKWIRFSTLDGRTLHMSKAAIMGFENPNETAVWSNPIGFQPPS